MDNDAGHKRKELKSNVKRWWHDWFGDYSGRIELLWYLALMIGGCILVLYIWDKL